jgi:Ni/Fe-hydrogenase subunit HybB-like protein
MTDGPRIETSRRSQGIALLLILVGALVAIRGLLVDPGRTWPNLLVDGFYFMSLGVSSIFFLAVLRLTGARWSASLRRVPEAFMLTLPVAAVLMLVLYFGRETLFPWIHPDIFAHEPAIAGKVEYLKVPYVFGRMVTVLLLWVAFAWLFRRSSLKQDTAPGSSLFHHQRLNRYAAVFVLVFAVSFTVSAYDWIISLDPHWFSTMFAVFVFAGAFVQGMAAVTLAAVVLRERRRAQGLVSDHQFHDLGKLLFAFSVFWMYIWTCQYLLIWYGNIPEEVTHYVSRSNGPWLYLFVLNPILNWGVPFTVLLSAKTKRRPAIMGAVCVILLCGHWLDLYLLIMPSLLSGPSIGLSEAVIALGYGALIYLTFVRNLAKAPLVPVNDPILAAEHLQHGHAHS